MAASRLSTCAAMAAAAAVVSVSAFSNPAYAESPFRFPPFTSSSPSSPQPAGQASDSRAEGKDKEPVDEPRSSGFDPEALERGAKALREINSSPYSKQVTFFILFILLGNTQHYCCVS